MLQFASEICAAADGLEVVEYDLMNPIREWDQPLDLAFSCFSSLDFGMTRAVARRLVDLLKVQGSLLIYIPDLLEEVEQSCKLEGNLNALEFYRRGEFQVQKPDHFTKRVEPFFADRIEKYISNLLATGCHLQALRFLDRGSDKRIIAMEFSRVT
ncbi:hypothetical protein AOQ71_24265 [Bradyrhizobium manausense]|uniref:Methyltransferase type 11 domain-containing protein n=2 Tax=Bradyrhizobium manausense TaxID=989370 RepID=A0A0R3DB77_9BRAD|nr:hypothetical protein AOQ71_24265 [Bradyrhizobium manausense]